ncbi:protein DMP7 isoform X1 [Capsella rubella]|uniref:protein DMP7 isoform X1 n=1 Tax=Capsella rubella TaxID=81985 RepID=UPI000CD4B5F0|nr:protein DMP7 isoform X1 [Capsella rubella]
MEETKQSLIASLPAAPRKPKSKVEKFARKTFKGTTHLSNLLPTGSVMSFQIMCPVLTHQGQCPTITSRWLTCFLVFVCAISCFIFSFTDSIRDPNGKIRYGIATWTGLCVIDGSITLTDEEKAKYKLQILDFVHAIMSMLVFFAISMFDQNVTRCLFPVPSEETKEVLTSLPFIIGVFCGGFFLAFPTRRHGIGSPLTKE